MQWQRWFVVSLAGLLGGWMAYDGSRALLKGDYVTPSSGEHAGQLGGWSRVVSAVGLEPRSTFVKSAHVVLGIAWLVAAVGFLAGAGWAKWGIAGCAVASLWYVPFGTFLAIAELLVLWSLPPGGA